MEHEITYIDGANVVSVTGRVSLIGMHTVVVETDGAAFFIPAKLVIAWKEIA